MGERWAQLGGGTPKEWWKQWGQPWRARGTLAARGLYGLKMYRVGDWRGSQAGIVVGGEWRQPKKRPSQHKSKSPKQFPWIAFLETSELKGPKSTYCPLGATCLSRFWEQKVKWVRRKIGQTKNELKKTDRTNITATNFVWEQLMKHNRLRRANWLLASSVASYGLVNPALARFDSSTFSILALLVNKSKNRYSKILQNIEKF